MPTIHDARPRQWYDPRSYRNGRGFAAHVMRLAYKRAAHHCQECNARLAAGDTFYDHIVPYALSRDSSLANCQVLCGRCHDQKTTQADVPAIAAAKRAADFHRGITGPGRGATPLPAGRNSPVKKTIRGAVVPRLSQAEQHRALMAQRYVASAASSSGFVRGAAE